MQDIGTGYCVSCGESCQEPWIVGESYFIQCGRCRYKYLHRLLSGISSRTIWERLYHDKDFQEILKVVPDEFADWIKKEKEDLKKKYMEILWEALDGYIVTLGLSTRKEKAILVQKHYAKVSPIIFSMIDGKQYATLIWKMIYPEYRIPKCSEKKEIGNEF